MCVGCGGTCEKGIAPAFGRILHHKDKGVTELGARNAVLDGYTDKDTGPNTVGTERKPLSVEQVDLYFQAMQARYMRMMADQVFDTSHPVEEYGPVGSQSSNIATNVPTFNIPANYDMPEKIEVITFCVPAGATYMTLQLGDRLLTLYGTPGNVTANPASIFSFVNCGIIINADDARIVNIAGTLTSAPYVSLQGFALTRGQFA